MSPEGMAAYKPDGDGIPQQIQIRIMIMMVVVVLMVMMVITSLRLGVQGGGRSGDDVFVNCDRRFGRRWTRRFLPVPVCIMGRAGSGRLIELIHQTIYCKCVRAWFLPTHSKNCPERQALIVLAVVHIRHLWRRTVAVA